MFKFILMSVFVGSIFVVQNTAFAQVTCGTNSLSDGSDLIAKRTTEKNGEIDVNMLDTYANYLSDQSENGNPVVTKECVSEFRVAVDCCAFPENNGCAYNSSIPGAATASLTGLNQALATNPDLVDMLSATSMLVNQQNARSKQGWACESARIACASRCSHNDESKNYCLSMVALEHSFKSQANHLLRNTCDYIKVISKTLGSDSLNTVSISCAKYNFSESGPLYCTMQSNE